MFDIYTYKACEIDDDIAWDCKLKVIDQHSSFSEAIIEGRGSAFHIIVGPQINGMFLCIPNWKIGCELASLTDTFWNSEKLSHLLNPIDTITVVTGLACLSKIQSDNRLYA